MARQDTVAGSEPQPAAPAAGTPAADATRAARPRRVPLGEALLLCDDAPACAERALAWLAERAGVGASLCLVLDPSGSNLVPLAARGLGPRATVAPVFVSDADHPLARALRSPAEFDAPDEVSACTLPPPLDRGPLVAFPLAGDAPAARDRAPLGLLVFRPEGPRTGPNAAARARRAARLLGRRLAQIRGAEKLARDGVEQAELFAQIRRASSELEDRARQASAELVRQNEMLRRQATELEQSSSLRSQFLANVSHEFRTPLNAILGYTSALLQGVQGALTPQQQRALTRVDGNARHLLAIINDVLDITRIESGGMAIQLSEVPIPDLLAEVLAELGSEIRRTGLAVTTDIPPGLPPVLSDRQKVKHIVSNLMSNALKFTPRGWVRASAARDESAGTFSISVADSGIGIAEADQARVFEDFAQVDGSPTRPFGGTGLGLALSRRLAAMLGGTITLTSRLGEGSTFTLVLPSRARPI